jgi:dTDP-4-amino-4,6-dideoxygalactose transaminase
MVLEILDSGQLTEGDVTRKFENAVGEYVGSRHAIAVTSCTTGLELALRALNIGPGDEVIVPDYTYPATAAVVNIVGAVAVIVDVNQSTMIIDYDSLEAAITPKTKAAIPVSLFGNPLNWDRLNTIKEKHGIFMVEDAACALGASYRKRPVGILADISVFSLHPRKFITTGEGGIITTINREWARWMDAYKHFGMNRAAHGYQDLFTMVGGNYKLSNLQAAVGLAQMEAVDELLEERRARAARYQRLLGRMDGVTLPQTTPAGLHSYQTFTVFVQERDRVMHTTRQQGIETQIGTYSLHAQPAFQNNPRCLWTGELTGSRFVFDHCLALPLYAGITNHEQDQVIAGLGQAIQEMRS